MIVRMFNLWYFFWLLFASGTIVGLYFLLRNKSQKTKKWTLFSILLFALILHFVKLFFPPYTTNQEIALRDSWFINICGANIALFPFLFLFKNKYVKDYIFYMGIIGGGLALLYPTEALNKTIENPLIFDTIRFYLHHTILFAIPLLMVMLKVHQISYKRILSCPVGLLIVMLFIMLNQVLQSELGFIPLRKGDIFNIGYKNTSFIWGPGDDSLAQIFVIFCPKFFRVIPFGEFAGQEKFWPWFWLIIPVFIYLIPFAFMLSMIFDHKKFRGDVVAIYKKIFKKTN
ncbi:MAG: YwaF family protein [Clostridia bacterium]|nr:YwaF family protein [Clostridia bacterium]